MQVSHRRIWTWANPCCFARPEGRKGMGASGGGGAGAEQRSASGRFRLQRKMKKWICAANPWLVLHKVGPEP